CPRAQRTHEAGGTHDRTRVPAFARLRELEEERRLLAGSCGDDTGCPDDAPRLVVGGVELDSAVDQPRGIRLALGDEAVQLSVTDGNHGYRLSIVDLRDSPDEAEFRGGVRRWLEANLPAGDSREWSRKLYDAGYAGLTWPAEYGGKGAP